MGARWADAAGERLAAAVAGLGGVFRTSDALAAGYSRQLVTRRIRAGRWRRVAGDVLVVGGAAPHPMLVARAAALAVPHGVVSHWTAAAGWAMPVGSRPVVPVHLVTGRRVTGPRGTVLHRVPLPRADVTVVDGIPMTTRRRTVVDCLMQLPPGQDADLFEWALRTGAMSVDDLAAAAWAAFGRPGVSRLRAVRARCGANSWSAGERELHRILRRARNAGWRANVAISDAGGLVGIGDVVFEAARLVLEVDGMASHAVAGQFQGDRTRQNRLTVAGWTVLRFTWHDLVDRPDLVVAQVRAALRRAGA